MKPFVLGTATASLGLAGALLLTGCGSSNGAADDASPSGGSLAEGTLSVSPVAISADTRDRLNAVAVGPDGKLYTAGFTTVGSDQFTAVQRLTAEGKIDTTFGTNGVATVNVSVGKTAEQARSIVVQSDGKIVVSGTTEHDAAAAGDAAKDTDIYSARFDKDGKIDTTFGANGVARVDVGVGHAVNATTYVGDNGYGLTVLPSGGYALFGQTSAGSTRSDSDYVLVGLTATGAVDTTFGTSGYVKVDVGTSGDSARNVNVDGDYIVATGYSAGTDGVVRPVIVRTSLTGVLDAKFGKNGVASQTVLANVTESYQVRPQNGSYILAGYGKDLAADKVDLVTYRFTATGELDKTFGTNGVTRVDIAKDDDRARNLTVLPDGRILVVGSGKADAAKVQAMVVLLSKDGAPDTTFGTNGHLLSDLGGVGDSWYGVAVSKDGKTAYLAGYKGVATDSTTDDDDAVIGRLGL